MAENPSTWKSAELVIADAIDEWRYMVGRRAVGPTDVHLIANRLRSAGLLNDTDEPEIGWEGLRAHFEEKEKRIRH